MSQGRKTLRGLSRSYASGDVDRDSYRIARRELISAIVDGDAELAAFVPPAPESRTVFPYEDDEGDTTQEIIPPVNIARRDTPRIGVGLVLAAAAVAVLVLGLGWWLSRPAPLRTPGATPAPAAQAVVDTAPADDGLVQRFLAINTWSAESLDEFVVQWRALDAESRDHHVEAGGLRDLVEAVLAQIASETALMNIGDPREALAAQRPLLEFADALGLDDARLKRARRDWEDAAAAAAADEAEAATSPAS